MILALLSLWQQPIEISRSTDRQQLGIMLPIGVMIKDPSGGGNADTLQGEDGEYYLDRANHTGTQAIGTIDGLQTALDSKIESVAWGDIIGAIADGTLHTVAEWIIPAALGRYANLAALQVDYPFVEDLSESIDYVATQAAVNLIKEHPEKFSVIRLSGRHVWNRELIIDTPLCIDGGHRVNTIEQLNWTNATPTSGSYVMLTGDGATCRTIRTRRAYRGAHTDPHDTPLSSAINIQADGVTLRNLCVFMQITPSLVTNAANYNLQAAVTPTLSGGVGIAPNYWGAPQVYTPKAWADVAGAPAKNWDVGVFIGTRLKTTIESCSFAFFENASVYNDITNIASRPLTDWRGNALPANSVSGSDGMTMTKCYTFGSPYGVRVLGALPKSGLVSYGKDYKTSVQLTIATNPTSGDKLLIGGYDYDRITNLPASGSVFESTTFAFINSDEEAPTGEVGVVIGATTAQTAENLVRAITALLDDNDEGVSALIKPLFNYANYSNEAGSSVALAFARGFSNASLARFLNCFEIRHSNPTTFTVTSGQTDLGGGLYKIVPVVGSDPAPYFWGDTASDFIEDGRGAYGASDMYITECQLFALKRPSIGGTPVYVKQIRTDRNWQLDDGGGAAIEIDGLAGNSTRCIQKHFHSKNRVDGQSVLSHIRLGRANAVTLEQCHPDGTVSRPDIYSAGAASYGWLTRTPYTKVTAQVGYGVPRPHPDAARVTDGQYQSVGTTRLGNGGIDGYGALIGTRLRIEVPAVTGGEGRADVIGGNSGTATVRLGTTNNLNTFRLQFFGSSGNGYVRNYGGRVLYEVPTGSYHNFQFRDSTTGTTTSRARLTETSFDVLDGLRLGAISVGGVLVRSGAGSSEGVLTANIGSMYLRTDGGAGTTLYIKESGTGSTGWVSVGSSPIANTDALPEGSSNLYHTSQRVRDVTLTGFTASNTPITATDSIVQAAGKAQGQIDELINTTDVSKSLFALSASNKIITSNNISSTIYSADKIAFDADLSLSLALYDTYSIEIDLILDFPSAQPNAVGIMPFINQAVIPLSSEMQMGVTGLNSAGVYKIRLNLTRVSNSRISVSGYGHGLNGAIVTFTNASDIYSNTFMFNVAARFTGTPQGQNKIIVKSARMYKLKNP